jgi:hypothetical protein
MAPVAGIDLRVQHRPAPDDVAERGGQDALLEVHVLLEGLVQLPRVGA